MEFNIFYIIRKINLYDAFGMRKNLLKFVQLEVGYFFSKSLESVPATWVSEIIM
jgi:hypothetical protein